MCKEHIVLLYDEALLNFIVKCHFRDPLVHGCLNRNSGQLSKNKHKWNKYIMINTSNRLQN